jgi:hypothetical protein
LSNDLQRRKYCGTLNCGAAERSASLQEYCGH